MLREAWLLLVVVCEELRVSQLLARTQLGRRHPCFEDVSPAQGTYRSAEKVIG
jgi:hypothetical protein